MESEGSAMSGETTRTSRSDEASAGGRRSCCRAKGEIDQVACLWEKVEGVSKDMQLG
jgi:hypothetical protein